MNYIEAGKYWDDNVDLWAFARQGFGLYRDIINTPAFF